MRISIITDIHHGPTSRTCPDVKDPDWPILERIRSFVARAERERSDLILDLGDRICDVDRETDLESAAKVFAAFRGFSGPVVHVLGNHDVINLTRDDHARLSGGRFDNRVVDFPEARLIPWQVDVLLDREADRFPPVAEQLEWLLDTLVSDERPAIIATHVSFSGRTQDGNYYHHHKPAYASHPDHAAVRTAVEATGRAALWLSGHSHWNAVTNIGNLVHLTLQSFSERFTTYPLTAGTHADLCIERDRFSLEVHGNDPMYLRMPFRRSGDRPWLAPIRR